MNNYREISPEELSCSPVKLIGKDWLLITATDATKTCGANAMTASWGAMGVLWNKSVCICFVRPQRHTHKLLCEQNRFSIAFMSEEYRDALRLCGRESGRDIDKIRTSGLSATKLDGVPVINEADTLLICKKLYEDELREGCFIEPSVMETYRAKNDYHTFYVCEIEAAYKRI